MKYNVVLRRRPRRYGFTVHFFNTIEEVADFIVRKENISRLYKVRGFSRKEHRTLNSKINSLMYKRGFLIK